MFIVSLIEFSKHVQNEISAKVMPKAQNVTADFADEMKLSKATVSRFAKQMIKAGKIIRGKRVSHAERLRLVSGLVKTVEIDLHRPGYAESRVDRD